MANNNHNNQKKKGGGGKGRGGKKQRPKTLVKRSETSKGKRSNNNNKNGKRRGNQKRRRPSPFTHRKPDKTTRKKSERIPDVKEGDVRIIPLGGVEEVGKNLAAIETKDDIIVIDCGFQFSEEGTPGIDYTLPNTTYLEERKDKIRGMVITHGHLDHIGGIPYIMPRLGYPPIYCRRFTELMIRKRQEEFKHMPQLDINVVETRDRVKLGTTPVEFFGITHTIPDSMGIIIETPHGNIVNQADFKLDHKAETVSEEEQTEYKRVAEKGVLLLMADSTNVENEGFSTPEWKVHKDLDKIIRDTDGRLIIGAFASQIERLVKIIEFAENHGRSVVLEGRSMRTNLEVARMAGMLKTKPNTLISGEESQSMPPHKVLILATGSQGEEFAALNRMANKSHKVLAFNPRDTVVLSSSIVPGNEVAVSRLKDEIARSGARIITYRTSEFYVHGSGHGNKEELRWLLETLKPKFFVPQHGHHYMLRLHSELAEEVGIPENHIVIPDNGSIIEVQNKGEKLVKRKEKASSGTVTVDGFSIGDVQDVVIRDRQLLSEDGIFIVVVALNPKNGKLRKSPDIISRGFVYLRESQDLLQESRKIIKRVVNEESGSRPINFDNLKGAITDHLRKFLLRETAKRPLVIPVILGI